MLLDPLTGHGSRAHGSLVRSVLLPVTVSKQSVSDKAEPLLTVIIHGHR